METWAENIFTLSVNVVRCSEVGLFQETCQYRQKFSLNPMIFAIDLIMITPDLDHCSLGLRSFRSQLLEVLLIKLVICFIGQITIHQMTCHVSYDQTWLLWIVLSRKRPWTHDLPESRPPDDMSPATPGDHSPEFRPTWEARLRRPREVVTEIIK